MPRPTVTAATEEMYASLGHLTAQDEEYGWPLLLFCDALARQLQDVDDLARDRDDGSPGWSAVMNADTAPADWIDWLAQFVGVAPNPAVSLAQKRVEAKAAVGWQRGTPAAMKAVVGRALAGGKQVTLIERNPTPYSLIVQVFEPDVPGGDTEAVRRAALTQKPAGLILDFQVLPGATYGHMKAAHGPTYADYAMAFATFADAHDHVPES